VKLAAGDAVVYPASTLHRVAPVRSGTRLAAITWIRSVVRDAAQRELLAELELAMTSLESRAPDARSEIDLLRKTHHNLIRMWAD
jgi:PKHD-type hydroxylase